jgi:hypothetical protein
MRGPAPPARTGQGYGLPGAKSVKAPFRQTRFRA